MPGAPDGPRVCLCAGCAQHVSEGPARGREWTQAQIAAAERGVVAVLYASAYGNTAALAQAISRGVTKAGTRRAPRTRAAASSAA